VSRGIRHNVGMAKKHKTWKEEAEGILKVGPGFVLADVDTKSTPGFKGNERDGEKVLERGLEDLTELQEKLYAASKGGAKDAVLLVLQAMDTAGKGGIVRHVVGAVDPQGVSLAAFKKPTAEESSHHFLWRIEKRIPQPGYIGVFDRSHYEQLLVVKVHTLEPPEETEKNYGVINEFEKRLVDSGIRLVKVMLHISADEQKARLRERLDRADKYWKYNPGDVDERMLWPEYMDAYQTMLERTSTDYAPWFVVPADNKWYARMAVQDLLLAALEDIDPQWPDADFDIEAEKVRLAAT
jgi:PPK2 family polyphosphate:nucleotide phosphotransferase